ncbi:DUF3820 family protein [Hydrogenovibrio sp. 3SP14C1]|uniref:DUF3820 family protein n=1 Tax=Hydrogenovibrio sp. 3SP14C1 TaxID=3038774 RepID=UPI0024166A2D|nr:DUF3820 family protein [Hydrogenovibrio sp. 3SP14C1]MDG4812464.1 DUF3820 family protein [Hydrogenovibrio sp. 3SP14C1]
MNLENLKKLVTVTMPYGKYKGRVIADLPGNYLNWFAREGFSSGNLGQLLALILNLIQKIKQLYFTLIAGIAPALFFKS